MTILLTGATGFMGTNIFDHYTSYFHNIIPISRQYGDLRDYDTVKWLIDSYQPDVILHFASNPNVKHETDSNILEDNIKTTYNLLDNAKSRCKFVLASSILVYGDMSNTKTEEDICSPLNVYGATKLASEALVNAYTSMNRVIGYNLRFCPTVGKYLTHGIIKDFCRKLTENVEFTAFGNKPGSIKPFIHITDVIQAIEMCLHNELPSGSYNVVSDDNICVDSIAKICMETLNINKPIKWMGKSYTWSGDNNVIKVSNELLKSFGWKPNFPFSKDAIIHGIIDNIEYLKQN
jgi:UDP-glucose 4-epimerase